MSYGIALTVTGPFGDPDEYEDDLRAFADFCTQRSLTPVFYSVHAEQRDALVSAGWNALDVGTEMVIDPGRMADARQEMAGRTHRHQQSQARRHHRRARHIQGIAVLRADADP